MAVSFYYCFSRGRPYDNDEVESPSMIFDYVLYFGCLVLSATLGLHRDALRDLPGLDDAPVHRVGGVRAARVPVRQPVRAVAGDLDAGRISRPQDRRCSIVADTDILRFTALAFGTALVGLGVWLHRQAHQAAFSRHLHSHRRQRDHDGHGLRRAGARLLAGCISRPCCRSRRPPSILACASIGLRSSPTERSMAMSASARGCSTRSAAPPRRCGTSCITGMMIVIGLVVLARRFGRDE